MIIENTNKIAQKIIEVGIHVILNILLQNYYIVLLANLVWTLADV